MVEYERTDERELAPSMRMKICVAGVGGGGLNVLDRISLDRMMEATLVSMHTDVRVLGHAMTPVKIQLGAERMRGIGSGGDPENGCSAAIDSREQIRAALQGHDMVFVCCGLGGGTGSGAAPVVAEVAKEVGAMVFVFATMPFSFEGRRRIQQAEVALEHLGQVADALILFENNRMGELTLPKEGIQKAFSQADQLIGHSVRAIATMVMQPGIVKMGIADLLTALRGPNSRCLFGFGEARGTNRVADALKRALKSPLVNQGLLLQNARNLLVHVAGGESLTLAEVESLMKQLGKYVPEETQIMFGLAVEPKLADMISVTLISSLSAQEITPESMLGRTERSLPVAAPASLSARQAEVEPELAETEAPVQEVPVALAPETPVHYQNGHAPVAASVPEPQPPIAPVAVPAQAPAVEMAAPPAPEPQLFHLEVPAPAPVEPDLFSMKAAAQPVVAPAAPVAPLTPEPAAVAAPASVFQLVDEPAAPSAPEVTMPDVAQQGAADTVPAEENEDILKAEQQFYQAPAPEPVVAPAPPPATKASIFSIIEDDDETEDEAPVVASSSAPVSYPDNGEHWADKYRNAPVPPSQPSAGPSTPLNHQPQQAEDPPNRRPEARVASSQPVPAGVVAGGNGADFKQSTFDLSQEEVARFKGTDKTIVEGEDLDVPTWMRLRQRVKR